VDSGDLPTDVKLPCFAHGGAGTALVLDAPGVIGRPNAYDLIRS
jgi:hypothetical protein